MASFKVKYALVVQVEDADNEQEAKKIADTLIPPGMKTNKDVYVECIARSF